MTEIRLKLKYRTTKAGSKGKTGYMGNSGKSFGKHAPHPDVFAFRRDGYRCEPKWNPKAAVEA